MKKKIIKNQEEKVIVGTAIIWNMKEKVKEIKYYHLKNIIEKLDHTKYIS